MFTFFIEFREMLSRDGEIRTFLHHPIRAVRGRSDRDAPARRSDRVALAQRVTEVEVLGGCRPRQCDRWEGTSQEVPAWDEPTSTSKADDACRVCRPSTDTPSLSPWASFLYHGPPAQHTSSPPPSQPSNNSPRSR